MRRRHGGRRSRVRCTTKVADFLLLAAAVNPARLGVLGPCQATGPDGMTAKTALGTFRQPRSQPAVDHAGGSGGGFCWSV